MPVIIVHALGRRAKGTEARGKYDAASAGEATAVASASQRASALCGSMPIELRQQVHRQRLRHSDVLRLAAPHIANHVQRNGRPDRPEPEQAIGTKEIDEAGGDGRR